MESLAGDLGVSVGALVAIALLAMAQLAVQVYAVVDLITRKRVQHLDKVVWALIVVLGSLLGALIYLAVGRGHETHEETQAPTPSGGADRRAASAADVLYGTRPGAADDAGPGSGAGGTDAEPGEPRT